MWKGRGMKVLQKRWTIDCIKERMGTITLICSIQWWWGWALCWKNNKLLWSSIRNRNENWITRKHNECFILWLKEQVFPKMATNRCFPSQKRKRKDSDLTLKEQVAFLTWKVKELESRLHAKEVAFLLNQPANSR